MAINNEKILLVNFMMYNFKLKELREQNKLMQNDLAKILSIGRNTYTEYESEYKIIPIKHLNTLCNYFNVSLDYMFSFTDVKQYENSNKEIDTKLAGGRLKEFRKEHKLTQVKLASILNTVHPVIVNYENGKNLIATPFLYTICKKYGVSADYLLGKTNESKYFNLKR